MRGVLRRNGCNSSSWYRTAAEPSVVAAGRGGGYRLLMELPPTACACPQCGQTFEPAEPPVNGILECPACHAQFFASISDDDGVFDDHEADEARRAEEARQREDELDA